MYLEKLLVHGIRINMKNKIEIIILIVLISIVSVGIYRNYKPVVVCMENPGLCELGENDVEIVPVLMKGTNE